MEGAVSSMRTMRTTTGGAACLAILLLAGALRASTPDIERAGNPAVQPAGEGTDASVAEPGDGAGPDAEVPEVGHPYAAIVVRNAFGLTEPPPPPSPPPKEVTPPVSTSGLHLTGITTLLGKRAMFAYNDGRTNRVSDLVREGERDSVITNLEVLEIDALAGAVKVIFAGQELRLDFENNGIRPPTNTLAAAAGGLPRPGSRPVMPTVGATATALGRTPVGQAGATTFDAGRGSVRTLPTRPTRLGGAMSMSGPSPGAPVLEAQPPALTPEQQVIVLQEQHRMAQEHNIELPPMPPAPGLEHLSGPPALPGMGGPPALPGSP